MFVTYCMVIHGPPAICTEAPRPSRVLKEFIMSSSFSWIVMSRLNMIQRGSS